MVDTSSGEEYLLPTRFPFLSPSPRHLRTSIACSRVAVLGGSRAHSMQLGRINNLKHISQPSLIEDYLTQLFSLPTTQCVMMQRLYLTDLISLRQVSCNVRYRIDREPFLWRTINAPSLTPIRSKETQKQIQPYFKLITLTRFLRNHLPQSALSPHHHIRVLNLDYQDLLISDVLNLIYANDCLRLHVKMLSMKKGNCSIDQDIRNLFMDWKGHMMLNFRQNYGWKERWQTLDDGSVFLAISDSSGRAVDRSEWITKRGFAMEYISLLGDEYDKWVPSLKRLLAKAHITMQVLDIRADFCVCKYCPSPKTIKPDLNKRIAPIIKPDPNKRIAPNSWEACVVCGRHGWTEMCDGHFSWRNSEGRWQCDACFERARAIQEI